MSPSLEESLESPLDPRSIWILGAGRFGCLAAERLVKRYRDADLMVIDLRPDRLVRLAEQLGVRTCAGDGVDFLSREELGLDLWIVPAIPVHAAFQWLLRRTEALPGVEAVPVPESVDPQVPNPYRVPDGTVYTSFANFRCPDNCNEPENLCTVTREPRLTNLFEELATLEVPGFAVEVIRSFQLAPGVGGYTGGQLRNLERRVVQAGGSCVIATSCRCHGVINALRRT